MEVSKWQTPLDRAIHERPRCRPGGQGEPEVIRRADEDLHVLYL